MKTQPKNPNNSTDATVIRVPSTSTNPANVIKAVVTANTENIKNGKVMVMRQTAMQSAKKGWADIVWMILSENS
jgi:hypothetical protein